ncbi:NADPH-dependent FMN reductase [Parapedobacter sp. 10938]|uniref:NADPH-dependent FMN reductase n=1 Tax=Parapedobacter flavus TaxID=3110225 RepID=UPI002DB9111F|nr:NADPH-dependent FMN reductase [Parapedobacter sp. 10938]MEC3879635.1 NADPH-dependent FMN reductase [Parapedobacter sp. 10938]
MSNTIGIIAGSLRKASFSKKLANAITAMAPSGFAFNMIPLDDLPVYNQDFDDEDRVPESYTVFRDVIGALDGVIFVTPEYNRSIPGVLKNALDVGSRPYGKNMWNGKPGAVFSNSPGNLSAFGANHHLRQCLVFLNVPAMQQPEVYLPNMKDAFDETGNLTNEETRAFLQQAVDAYIDWFNKLH